MQTTIGADIKKGKTLPKRDEIDKRFKWKLENIYPDNNEWEKDYNKIKELLPEVQKFKGTFEESVENLLGCLKLRDQLLSIGDKLFVYARMRRDEDNANPVYQALTDKAMALLTNLYAEISFIEPEIVSIDEVILKKFINKESELKIYKHFLDDILRQKQHTLSKKEEELLALAHEIAQAPSDIFSMLNNADIKFPLIKDENGEMVELTKGRYIKFLENTDRRVRKDAYEALYGVYGKFKNTFAASLSSNVKKDLFFSRVKKYNSSLEASLDYDNISTEVYDNLIKTVDNNLHLLHRYVNVRKRAMGLGELHMYDLYVPIVKEPVSHVDYQEACSITEKGLQPLGKEYLGYFKQAFNSGWVDVYENEGKTSGAYSWGSYLTHPYVLLNFQNSINDIFTIAHEMGHAMHTFYTNKTQPYVCSRYRIFVAEVASIVNELLVMDYLLKTSKNKEEKAYLLNNYLEEFRGTLFRQTMFAEFEKIIHSKMSSGEALTCDILSDIYSSLNKKYYGDNIIVDDNISIEWARIPHFYSSFYVYKYATGFSAAASLSKHILDEGETAAKRYIEFLSSGSSDYPIELLKKAGVDLTTPAPIEDALKKFESILDEFDMML